MIGGMRNLNMDRERQERVCDEVNYTQFFCKYERVYPEIGGLKSKYKMRAQGSPAQSYITQPSSIIDGQ